MRVSSHLLVGAPWPEWLVGKCFCGFAPGCAQFELWDAQTWSLQSLLKVSCLSLPVYSMLGDLDGKPLLVLRQGSEANTSDHAMMIMIRASNRNNIYWHSISPI